MSKPNHDLRASARVMKVTGWGIIIGGPILMLAYAPGFFWGSPHDFPLLRPAHPPSPFTARTRTCS